MTTRRKSWVPKVFWIFVTADAPAFTETPVPLRVYEFGRSLIQSRLKFTLQIPVIAALAHV